METPPDALNLPSLLFGRAAAWPQRPMLRYRAEGEWRQIAWREFAWRAAAYARFLRTIVAAGDRVVMVSDNRPEFLMAEVALMAIGAVPVPTYTINSLADHAHILRDSGATVAIAGSAELADRLREASKEAAPIAHLLVFSEARAGETLLPGEGPEFADDIVSAAAVIPADRLACIIYTSGTSGPARGVMLSHRSILSNIKGVAAVVAELDLKDETYLSFLPAAHSFEHTVGGYLLPALGVEIAYATGIEHLAENMQQVRPTIIAAVPRLLEVIRGRIEHQAACGGRVARGLYRAALAAGRREAAGTATAWDRVALPVLERLVRRKVRGRFGGRLRLIVSGGARLSPETGLFYQALGFMLLQGYGQTEAGPVISVNKPPHVRAETVGPPLLGVEVKIAADGEILVRGDLVMQGYWNRPEATANALAGGWLHTGDIGRLDPDGHLVITDRKKDLIVLSGGENISPAYVEAVLMAERDIHQAVISGEGKPYLTALIVPAQDATPSQIAAAVARANNRLSSVERIRRHHLVPPFTIENALLTPTQKIRRARVIEQYREVLS